MDMSTVNASSGKNYWQVMNWELAKTRKKFNYAQAISFHFPSDAIYKWLSCVFEAGRRKNHEKDSFRGGTVYGQIHI